MALFGHSATSALSPVCAAKRTSADQSEFWVSRDVTDPYSANFFEMIHELRPLTKTIDQFRFDNDQSCVVY
ncbi:MAG: hypothetical protein QOI22_1665 [Verrucomicrobiota bacterium]|jgi:hypothetical protein